MLSFTEFTCLCSEVCLYMATVGYFVSCFGQTGSLLMYAFVFILGGSVLALCRGAKSGLRYLPFLLFVPAFVFRQGDAGLILPLPLMVYWFFRAKNRTWSYDHDNAKTMFRLGFCAVPLAAVIVLFTGNVGNMLSRSLPFFLVWMLLGVLNLRLLRGTVSFGLRHKLINVVIVAVVGALGFAVSRRACIDAVLALLGAIYTKLILPVIFAVGRILIFIPNAVMGWLRDLLGSVTQNAGETEIDINASTENFSDLVVRETPQWVEILLTAIIIAAVAAVVVLILKKLSSVLNSRGGGEPAKFTSKGGTVSERKKRPARSRTPAESVRSSYRKYLVLCAKHGITVDGSDASDVICRASQSCFRRAAVNELRELWLPARFSGQEITKEHAAQAKTAVRELTKEKN